MSGHIMLGVDLGTLGMKVIAVDAMTATVVGTASAPIENLSPATGYLEQVPERWWTTLCQLTRQLLDNHDIAAESISAIGLSGHMHSIVPLRADGSVAHNCIVWADTRSQAQADYIATHSRTPLWNPAIAPFSIAKVLWLREHEPEVFGEVAYFLFSKDYLRYRITGEIGTDFADASGTLIWDFALREWDGALLAELNVPASMFPPAHSSAEMAGTLTANAARDLGLSPGTVVAYGAGDAACAVVGSGVPDRDTLMINAGTAVQIIEMQDKPTPFHSETAVRYLFELGVDGATFAIGALNSAGHSLDWWRNLLDPAMSYDEFNALTAGEPSAADGPLFLPYLQRTGTPYLLDGPYGSFTQLSATADKRSLTRAVMDGVAFGIKLCAEALVTDGTLPDKKILFTGGVPKSPLMRAILNNVFAGQVTFRGFSDMSALGAAAHAAVAVGISADAAAFLADFDYGEITPAPNPLMQARYAGTYARYKEWADRITNV